MIYMPVTSKQIIQNRGGKGTKAYYKPQTKIHETHLSR